MVKKKKGKGFGKGTFIETKMVLSKAYQSLGVSGTGKTVSSFSHVLLHLFLLKRQFGKTKDRKGAGTFQRADDNQFTMTYEQLMAKPFNCTQPRVTRSFDELLEKGFISIADPGGAYEKHKAVYELVEDYLYWKPGDPPLRTRETDAKRGYQGQGLGVVKSNINTHARCTPTHTRTLHIPSVGHTHA